MNGTTVRLIRRGDQHPYVIEVTTPGWRGCDHAFTGTIKETEPAHLKKIQDCLENAGVKYYSVSEPDKAGVVMYMADGTTEFILRNKTDFDMAIEALVRDGWLSPEMPPHQTIQ